MIVFSVVLKMRNPVFLNIGRQSILCRGDESPLLGITDSPCHSERSEESISTEW